MLINVSGTSRAIVTATVVTTLGSLPVFLVSALVVLIRHELVISEAQLGLAVSVFFAAGAFGAVPSGLIVERVGGRRALIVGALLSAGILLGMSTASSWKVLVLWLGLAGVGSAICALAGTLRLAEAVASNRQQLAFGIKQASAPAAAMMAGLSVPVLGLRLGWRYVFVLAAGFSVIVGVLLYRNWNETGQRPLEHSGDRGSEAMTRAALVSLAVAAGFGVAASTAMVAFLVEYGVTTGLDAGKAGAALAVGGTVSIVARVVLGWVGDRGRTSKWHMMAGMCLMGGVSVCMFPMANSWGIFMISTTVAYGIGWGWPGLFHGGIVADNAAMPASALSVTLVGMYVGGVTGPLAFGLIASRYGYSLAWYSVALAYFATAVLLIRGGRLVVRPSLDKVAPTATIG